MATTTIYFISFTSSRELLIKERYQDGLHLYIYFTVCPLTVRITLFIFIFMQLRLYKPKSKEIQQIPIDLKKDKLESYYQVKRKLSRLEATVEAQPYWKYFISVFAFLLVLLLIIFNTYVTFTKYSSLPRQLPLVYSQSTNTWTLIDKEFYLLIPFLLLLMLFIQIRFNTLTFKFDRRLSLVVNLGLILSSLLGFIAYIQLFSFVLIY